MMPFRQAIEVRDNGRPGERTMGAERRQVTVEAVQSELAIRPQLGVRLGHEVERITDSAVGTLRRKARFADEESVSLRISIYYKVHKCQDANVSPSQVAQTSAVEVCGPSP